MYFLGKRLGCRCLTAGALTRLPARFFPRERTFPSPPCPAGPPDHCHSGPSWALPPHQVTAVLTRPHDAVARPPEGSPPIPGGESHRRRPPSPWPRTHLGFCSAVAAATVFGWRIRGPRRLKAGGAHGCACVAHVLGTARAPAHRSPAPKLRTRWGQRCGEVPTLEGSDGLSGAPPPPPQQPGSQSPRGRPGWRGVRPPAPGSGLASIPRVTVSAQPPARQPDGRFGRETPDTPSQTDFTAASGEALRAPDSLICCE